MEGFKRGVKAGRVSFSRHPSTPYLAEEKMEKIGRSGSLELCKEKPQLTTCYCPLEVPKSPDEAMEFLSRTWSPSSSDFFQIFSTNNLLSSPKERRREDDSKEMEEQAKKGMISFNGDNGSRVEQVLTLLSSGKLAELPQKHKPLMHSSWMNLGQMKSWLGREILSNLSTRSRRKRKEEFRLHEAQVHAALSVARLASAIAGIVANCKLEPIDPKAMSMNLKGGEWNNNMNTMVASAAALVATVCAEAAESVGAKRDHVASAISTGLVTRNSADMMALTATAATCLRGATTLELRAAASRHVSDDQKILAKGAQLPVRTPEGKVQLKMVWIYHKHDKLVLKLGKKLMRGTICTSKEYRIFDVIEDSDEGGFSTSYNGFYLITLGTSSGTIQVLFQDQKQQRIWKSIISHLLCDC